MKAKSELEAARKLSAREYAALDETQFASDDDYLAAVVAIDDKYNETGLAMAVVAAEDAMIEWAMSIVRKLPQYKQHAELLERTIPQARRMYSCRQKLVTICFQLDA